MHIGYVGHSALTGQTHGSSIRLEQSLIISARVTVNLCWSDHFVRNQPALVKPLIRVFAATDDCGGVTVDQSAPTISMGRGAISTYPPLQVMLRRSGA